jgi:hypothetical protein
MMLPGQLAAMLATIASAAFNTAKPVAATFCTIDAFDDGEVFHGGDVIEAEMIADADIGDDSNVAAIEGDAFAQNAAAGRFKNGGIDVRVLQHIARTARAAAVAGIDAFIFDVHAVGGGHADPILIGTQDMRDQAHGRGLAVGAGTATTGIRPSSPSGNMLEIIASPTGRPLPNDGLMCMRRPGAALTSTMPPPCSSSV